MRIYKTIVNHNNFLRVYVIMKKLLFVKNVLILTLTAILLRGMGIVFRIYISNKIGAEGMGLHQLIFSVYTLASALASSGISIVATRLISEKGHGKNSARKIMHRAFVLGGFFGFLACALLFFGADTIANCWLCDARAALSLKILSLGLPFMSLSSCLKGYFLARRKAGVTSGSQIFEQLLRTGIVALLFCAIDTSDLTFACAAVVCGNAVSEAGALAYIYIGYRRDIRKLPVRDRAPSRILRSLIGILLPVAFSSYLNTGLHTIENVTVPDALARCTLSRELALSQFGMLKGMALPLLFFPASFFGALSTLLIPEISDSRERGSMSSLRNAVSYTMLLTSVSSILIGGIFAVCGDTIARLVYNSPDVGIYLKVLGSIVPFMYAESITTGILNGLDCQQAILRYNIYNSVIRIVLITLVVPHFGMTAFLAIMIVSNIFTSCLSLKQLFASTGIRPNISNWVIKPFCALICGILLTRIIEHTFASPSGDAPLLAFELAVICTVYVAVIFITKAISKNDILRLFGRKKSL